MKMLKITPKKCLMDEKVLITLKNLNAAQKITIRCEVVVKDYIYESYGHFIASLSGTVDLSSDPSFGGSYVGVDQMGLFWSMLPVAGQRPGFRYIPRVVDKPQEFKLQVYDNHVKTWHVNINEKYRKASIGTEQVIHTVDNANNKPFIEDIAMRFFCGEGVTRHEIQHPVLRGVIFKPAGKGPFKGLIDMYGGAGGINETRAALLASHGFITMALPFLRYKDLPKTIDLINLEYFLDAVNFFDSMSIVQPGIGIIGLSGGATLGLKISTMTKKISSVVAISGCSYMEFPLKYKGKMYPSTENFVTNWGKKIQWPVHEKGGLLIDSCVYDERSEHLTFPLEETKAQFLIVVGQDDLMKDADFFAKRLVSRMERFGAKDRINVLSYPNVGHFVDTPYMPQTLVHYNPVFKNIIACGGDNENNAAGCIHAWKEILQFLKKNVGITIKVNSNL